MGAAGGGKRVLSAEPKKAIEADQIVDIIT